jgi:putative restriction endonuclease
MKAVLTHKPKSVYDNLPWERYHFPRTYLHPMEQAVGDLIVYYEPRREGEGDAAYRGRQAYVATARVKSLRPDPEREDHYYADMDNYLEFEQPVPFREGRHYFEKSLQKDDGTTNRGMFGRTVRAMPSEEFDAIVLAGFAREFRQVHSPPAYGPGVHEAPSMFQAGDADFPLGRPDAARVLSSRAFRDRAFADAVQQAYNKTCALTGLRLINGGGRAEAEAAHIRPVADQGPDTVRNGLALSGTVHWMFDRGLISIRSDRTISITNKGLPDKVRCLFYSDLKACFPSEPWNQPAPVFLQYHRERVFKG